jgi:hypothetical protein
MVRRLCGLKPRATLCKAAKLRTSNRAPHKRTTAVATSLATSTPRARFCFRPAPVRPPDSFSAAVSSVRPRWKAGTNPNKSPVRIAIANVNPATLGSSAGMAAISRRRGKSPGANANSTRTADDPSPRPIVPPTRASNKPSVSSCHTIRPRPAPKAARIAISF